MPRLFIALPMEKDNTSGKADEIYNYLHQFDNELKVVPPDNYHITLKFLGDCSEKQGKKIEENFDKIIESGKIFSYALFGIGVFPDQLKPEVIWAGIKTDEAYINKLYQTIEDFTSGLGFKKEKNKFIPHLTLARVRKGKKINQSVRQYLVENKETFLFESKFKRMILFSSTLTKEGPVYTELKSIQFKVEEE